MQFQGPKIDTYMYTDKHIVFVLNYMMRNTPQGSMGPLKVGMMHSLLYLKVAEDLQCRYNFEGPLTNYYVRRHIYT